MKLHLGCGDKKFEGYINVDIRGEVNPDIVDDISVLEDFNDESVELIYACHVLEHFGRHEYIDVLKKWHQKLESGGTLRISVPDIGAVIQKYNEGVPLRNLMGFLYGGQNYKENYHYIGFDFKTLSEDLKNIGFEDVHLWDWKEVEHGHIDDYSQSYIPHMDKDNGQLMSLNIEAKKI
jgi:predicted SAM-dependent methyltransferase